MHMTIYEGKAMIQLFPFSVNKMWAPRANVVQMLLTAITQYSLMNKEIKQDE